MWITPDVWDYLPGGDEEDCDDEDDLTEVDREARANARASAKSLFAVVPHIGRPYIHSAAFQGRVTS